MVLCAALSIIIIDETVLNVAIPALFRELHATSSEVQWAIDAYVIVYAALLFPAGNLGDRYGRRTFLIGGLVVFGIGSTIAAWAPDPATLIAGRTVMAVGGALIMPQTLSILVEVFSDRQRGIAIGTWSSIAGIGIIAGPIVGGWLIEHFWWGSVFLINIPIVVITLAATLWLLPNHRDRDSSPVDAPGTVLAIVMLMGLLWAVIEYPHRGLDDPWLLAVGAIGVVSATAFIVVELHRTHPMLDVRVFARPLVGVSSLVVVVVFLTLQGSMFVLTQYLQLIQGRGALATGLVYAPTSIFWSLSAPASTWLARRVGYTRVLSAALLLLAATYGVLATLGDTTGLALLLVVFSLQGLAMSLAITPVTDLIMGGMPRARSGVASAINDAARQVGGAIGVAVLGAMLASRFARHLEGLPDLLRIDNLSDAITTGDHTVIVASRQAFLSGYRLVMIVCCVIVAVGAFVVMASRLDRHVKAAESV